MRALVGLGIALGIAVATPKLARADDLPTLPGHPLKAPELPSELLVETHGWLRVAYHPSVFEGVRHAVGEADSLRASLATTLGQTVLEKVEVRIARTPEEMAALSPLEAPPPKGAHGVAYPDLGLVLLSQRTDTGAAVDLNEALRHELAHVAMFDAAAGRALPRWLTEGFAVYTSGESSLRRTKTLALANARRALVSFDRLETFAGVDPEIASAESADFVRFLARGEQPFSATISRVRAGSPLAVAAAESYGRDLRSLELAWRDDVGHRYLTVPLVASAVAGWGVAALTIWRRRKRRRALSEAPDISEPLSEPVSEEVVQPPPKSSRLIVTDRGIGHVVYLITGKGVPKVEHDGKRHTLH